MAELCGQLTPAQLGRLLASYGINQPVPDKGGVRHALQALTLVDDEGRITERGKELCKWIAQRLTTTEAE